MMIDKFSFLGGRSLKIHTIPFQIGLLDCIVNWFGLYLYRLMQSNYYHLPSPLVHNLLGADVPLIDRAIS